MKQFRIALFLSAALAAGIGFAVDFRPALVMRIDDGHPPADWRQVCAMFEQYGFRCSLAVCATSLELVGTDPVCDAENLQWIGGGFERYGCLK